MRPFQPDPKAGRAGCQLTDITLVNQLLPYIRLLRPTQWSKNGFLFAGIVFGRKLGDPDALFAAIVGFICFCLLSSFVYVVNDIRDHQEDRLHPRKRLRPIAAGQVSVGNAAVLAAVLLLAGLAGSWLLDVSFFTVGVLYLLLQSGYTFLFKHIVLLDIVAIGLGFVLRAIAGAVAVHVVISHWLVICTFTLCLFMGFSKRRCEITAIAENGPGADAGRHRRTLTNYTVDMLNHFTTLTAGIAIMCFLLYATDERTVREFHSNFLVYTLPLVVYAVFRYTYLVEHGLVDGPTEVLAQDRPFQAALGLWVVATVMIVYRWPRFLPWPDPTAVQ